MAARLLGAAGAAAAGGAAAIRYHDERAFAELVRWALGGASAPGAAVPAAAAAAAAQSVVPQIHINTASDAGGSALSWRLATAIGSGALAGIYWAYRSGVTLQDLTWVTQSVFEGAVDELQKAVAITQDAIEKCHTEVGMQIDELEQEVQDTRDHLEHTVKTEVGYNRDAINEVHQQLEDTDTTLREMQRQVATRKQLEELRALVDKMKSTGDSTYEELKQLHAEIRALAGTLIHQHAASMTHEVGGNLVQRSLTMGHLGSKLNEALALSERHVSLSLSNDPVLPVCSNQQPHSEDKDRPFTPPTDPVKPSPSSRSGLLRTNRNF